MIRYRQLTTKESWLLMGFSDTDFERAKSTGNNDSQLRKQAGNSIVVNVLEAILTNLLLEPNKEMPKGQTTIYDYI